MAVGIGYTIHCTLNFNFQLLKNHNLNCQLHVKYLRLNIKQFLYTQICFYTQEVIYTASVIDSRHFPVSVIQTNKKEDKMAYKGGAKVQKVMVQPIVSFKLLNSSNISLTSVKPCFQFQINILSRKSITNGCICSASLRGKCVFSNFTCMSR